MRLTPEREIPLYIISESVCYSEMFFKITFPHPPGRMCSVEVFFPLFCFAANIFLARFSSAHDNTSLKFISGDFLFRASR